MSETKHTLGPWQAGHWSGTCLDPRHVAARWHPGPPECVYTPEFCANYGGIAGAEPGQMVVDTSYDEVVISDADAHLIAAAPELLAALREFVRMVCDDEILVTNEHRDTLMAAFGAANTAIAKAEGR